MLLAPCSGRGPVCLTKCRGRCLEENADQAQAAFSMLMNVQDLRDTNLLYTHTHMHPHTHTQSMHAHMHTQHARMYTLGGMILALLVCSSLCCDSLSLYSLRQGHALECGGRNSCSTEGLCCDREPRHEDPAWSLGESLSQAGLLNKTGCCRRPR